MNIEGDIVRKVVAILAVWFLVHSGSLTVSAQDSRKGSTPPTTSKSQPKTTDTKDRQRRLDAVKLLDETLDLSAQVDDLYDRTQLQCRIADVYWDVDIARARAIFDRAWKTATDSDRKDDLENVASETAAPEDEARLAVVRAVANRDAVLSLKLLRSITGVIPENTSGEEAQSTGPVNPWHSASPDARAILAVAQDLLDKGSIRQSADLALAAGRAGISSELAEFIIRLATLDPGNASQVLIYAARSTTAAGDADANSALLLTAPLVSPSMFVVVDATGSLLFRKIPAALKQDQRAVMQSQAEPEVLRAAGAILIAQKSRDKNAAASYFAISSLLPYFDNSQPALSQTLRQSMEILSSQIRDQTRSVAEAQASYTKQQPAGSSDPLRSLSEALANSKNDTERDRIAAQMVKVAVKNRLWQRAKETAGQISDPGLRTTARRFATASEILDIAESFKDDKESSYLPVASFVDKSDAPPFAKCLGFLQLAEIARVRDGVSAARPFLFQAEHEANSTPRASTQRLMAFSSMALAGQHYEKQRMWEYAHEFVRTANEIPSYTGDEDAFNISSDISDSSDDFSFNAGIMRVENFFARLAAVDREAALTEARAFNGTLARAGSFLGVARAMISPARER